MLIFFAVTPNVHTVSFVPNSHNNDKKLCGHTSDVTILLFSIFTHTYI